MKKIIEAIPNFSEGKDQKKIKAIIDAGRIDGVKILDVESDPDHNRMLTTIVGQPEDVFQSVWQMIVEATKLIDMRVHKGEHPRIGATDVVPFVPVSGVEMDECIALSKRLGKKIAEELKIPVYLYEESASRPDRKNLANIRKGEYEGLCREIETNLDRKPDLGPSKMHPTAGAIVVGARQFLIAFNVDLDTEDLSIAQAIAKSIREKDGGLPAVKALGFEIKARNCVQVSINLCDFRQTNMDQVYLKIIDQAKKMGVKVLRSEVYGLLPLEAMVSSFSRLIQEPKFNRSQILETRVWGE